MSSRSVTVPRTALVRWFTAALWLAASAGPRASAPWAASVQAAWPRGTGETPVLPTGVTASPWVAPAAAQGRRTVDAVDLADAGSEAAHGFAGEGVSDGVSGRRRWRRATGWLGVEMKAYDDSPVTVVLAFVGPAGERRTFDLFVEGRLVVTKTVEAAGDEPAETAVDVPEALTLGKTALSVKIAARLPSATPALTGLRIVQEHLE